jgi:pSer/pThr/pTyr-binding forkhead associated (FHA) protein
LQKIQTNKIINNMAVTNINSNVKPNATAAFDDSNVRRKNGTMVPEGGNNNPQRTSNVPPTMGGNNRTVIIPQNVAPTGASESEQEAGTIFKEVGALIAHLPEANVSYSIREGKNVIGRDIECDVCLSKLADTSISRKHAIILYRHGEFKIEEHPERTPNDVVLNGIPLEESIQIIKDGDRITLGDTDFTFKDNRSLKEKSHANKLREEIDSRKTEDEDE